MACPASRRGDAVEVVSPSPGHYVFSLAITRPQGQSDTVYSSLFVFDCFLSLSYVLGERDVNAGSHQFVTCVVDHTICSVLFFFVAILPMFMESICCIMLGFKNFSIY